MKPHKWHKEIKAFIVVSALTISTVSQAGTLTGAVVGGAVGYAVGKSNSTISNNQDLVFDLAQGILIFRSIRLLPEGDRWIRDFVKQNGYRHYHVRKIIVRVIDNYETYYYVIKAWN